MVYFVLLALAQPAWQTIELEVMGRINYARTRGFDCQTKSYRGKPLAALIPHPKLHLAARAHAQDMQKQFSHIGSNGSSLAARIAASGYLASRVGENILGGQRLGSSAKSAVKWWLNSQIHCQNIMNPVYQHFAAGHFYRHNDPKQIWHYWAINFAAPV